jgi:N-acyl-D-amino-acid deacylase
MHCDLVLSGGTVVDGSGGPPRWADVGIVGERVVAVGQDLSATRRLDVAGLVVAPGFVDPHCHADVAVFDDELSWATTAQGVTTQIVGNCGWSAFPCRGGDEEAMSAYARPLLGGPGTWAHADAEAYVRRLRSLATNVVALVGHGMLRRAVLGMHERPAGPAERAALQALLATELRSGAAGMSAGLVYAPSAYADEAELADLALVVAAAEGFYAVHMRNESDRLLDNLDANVALARRSGAALQISHLKVAGREHWGRMHEALALLDKAHAGGVDVAFDVYPYTEASSLLRTLLPPWCLAGGVEDLLGRLADADVRRRVAHELAEPAEQWDNLVLAAGWDGIRPVGLASERYARWEGVDLATIAAHVGATCADTLCDLLLTEEGRPLAMLELMHADDVATALAHPLGMVGSDGIPANRAGHPRLYNTYLRLLARYAGTVLSLEDAVRKCSGAVADRFRLPQVGFVRAGARADLVVFDPADVREFDAFPRRGVDPSPLAWVLVGGVPVVADHEPAEARPGAVLTLGRK